MGIDYRDMTVRWEVFEKQASTGRWFIRTADEEKTLLTNFYEKRFAEDYVRLHNAELDRKAQPVTRLVIARNGASNWYSEFYVVAPGDEELRHDDAGCWIAVDDRGIVTENEHNLFKVFFESLDMFPFTLDTGQGPRTYELRGVFVPVETEEEAKT